MSGFSFASVFGPVLSRSNVAHRVADGTLRAGDIFDTNGDGQVTIDDLKGTRFDHPDTPANDPGVAAAKTPAKTPSWFPPWLSIPAPDSGGSSPQTDIGASGRNAVDTFSNALANAIPELEGFGLRVLLIVVGVTILIAGALALRPSTGETIAEAIREK